MRVRHLFIVFMKTRTAFLLAALLLVVGNTAMAADDAKLSVTLNQRSITASGLAPGSTAVFFGVAQVAIPHAYMRSIRRWAVTVDDTAHTGTVTFDMQQDVPDGSVWAVVDLRNAHYGMVSGSVVGLRQAVLSHPFRKGQSQAVDRFVYDHGYLDLLYVHPGAGAWTWSVIGGSTPENGGPNNSTIVSLADGKPVGQSGKQPPSFLPGGLLIAIDFTQLQFAVVPVDQQLLGDAR
jgi:hypothetical protein